MEQIIIAQIIMAQKNPLIKEGVIGGTTFPLP